MAAGGDDPARNDRGGRLLSDYGGGNIARSAENALFFQNPVRIHPIMKETRILGG
jgi:hypothetical protein